MPESISPLFRPQSGAHHDPCLSGALCGIAADGSCWWTPETAALLGLAPTAPRDVSGLRACLAPGAGPDFDALIASARSGKPGEAFLDAAGPEQAAALLYVSARDVPGQDGAPLVLLALRAANPSCELHADSHYRALFENAVVGVFRSSVEGRFLTVNPAMAAMFGYDSPAEMITRIQDLGAQFYAVPGRREDFLARILAEGRLEDREEQYLKKDGSAIWCSISVRRLDGGDGNPCFLEGIIVDIHARKASELELLRARERFERLVNDNPAIIYTLDPSDFSCTFVSANVRTLLGYEPKELLQRGSFWSGRIHPDDREQAVGSMELALINGDSAGEYRFQVKDGQYRWMRDEMTLVVDEAGRPLEIIGHWFDIHERRTAEGAVRLNEARLEALARLSRMQELPERQLAEFAVDEVVRLTGSRIGYLHLLEDQGRTIELYSWGKSVKSSCTTASATHYPVNQAGLWAEAVRSGRSVIHNDYPSHPGRRELPGGHPSLTRHMGVPLLDNGTPVAVIGVGNKDDPYDQTDVRQLFLFLDGLWRIFKERRAREALVSAKRDAEAASLAKSEFLATMSHEIRTPLNGLLGMLQLLLISSLNEEQTDAVTSALGAGRSLSRLLDDILDLSRVEAGKLELVHEPFTPAELLGGVRDMLAQSAAEKGLALEVDLDQELPSRLSGDAGRIRQILFNLAGNAIKFTDTGSVRVSARLEADHGEKVCASFSVKDTGIGIPPEKQQSVFEPFTQLEATHTRSHRGAGLGLSIVRRLAALMNARLAMDSAPGQGTSVTLRMELSKVEDKEAAEASGQPDDGASLTLLAVEDDPESAKWLCRLLAEFGHTVELAVDGEEALAMLADRPYDAVLLDVQLPRVSGLDVVRAIRAGKVRGLDRKIPVIGLTAFAMHGEQESFQAAGMDLCLPKPVDYAALLRALAAISPRASEGC